MNNYKKTKLLQARIDKELEQEISKLLQDLNKNSDIELSESEFTRLSLKHFCKEIKKNGLSINLKPA